jgi:hypothetical protein
MRTLFIVIVICGLVVWLFMPHLTPVKPDSRVPTFEQALADREALKDAAESGRLREDPQRRALRQAILRAADREEASPCDNRLRQALGEAIAAFFTNVTAAGSDSVETITVSNREINSSVYFNEQVRNVFHEAIAAHISIPGMPAGRMESEPSGRLACINQ